MTAFIFLITLTGFFFLAFLIFLVIGIAKKKVRIVIYAVFMLIASFISGGCVFHKVLKFGVNSFDTFTSVINKSLDDYFAPKTGKQIYEDMFDKSTNDCVQVIQHQDAEFPIIDYSICLHVSTCPKEMERILLQEDYMQETLGINEELRLKMDYGSSNSLVSDWFKPFLLGDTIHVYNSLHEYNLGKQIFMNSDSTEAYIEEIVN